MKALIIVGEDAGEPVYAIGQDAQGLPYKPMGDTGMNLQHARAGGTDDLWERLLTSEAEQHEESRR